MTYADQKRQWTQRRAAIIEHYRQTESLRETGEAFGISGERVRQIVSKERTKDGQDHTRGSDVAPAAGAGRHG